MLAWPRRWNPPSSGGTYATGFLSGRECEQASTTLLGSSKSLPSLTFLLITPEPNRHQRYGGTAVKTGAEQVRPEPGGTRGELKFPCG